MKAVIFDMDGVIFNTENLWKTGFIIANKKYNLNLDENYRKTICGKSEQQIREELKLIYNDLDVDSYRNSIVKYVEEEIKNKNYIIKDGFIELINYLKNKNYKIALATSSTKKRAEYLFNNKGLDINMFDALVFAEDVGKKSKPDPFIFTIASNKLGISPNNCYVIEDSINGIVAANDGGFIPIMAIDLIKPDDYCINNCIKIVKNLDELIEFFNIN